MNTLEPTNNIEFGSHQGASNVLRINCTAGLGLAGFFGSPLALAYLLYRDLVVLDRPDLRRRAAAWFGPLSLFWLYCLLSFPPDFISQFMLYFPQTILWWIVVRHLLGNVHVSYRNGGGLFFSRWRGVRTGLVMFGVLKLVFFLISYVLYP